MSPIIFDTTVNRVVYQEMITKLIAFLERECWLQQDGVTRHTSNETMNFLCKFVISKGLWSPRPPNFPSRDSFLDTSKDMSIKTTHVHYTN